MSNHHQADAPNRNEDQMKAHSPDAPDQIDSKQAANAQRPLDDEVMMENDALLAGEPELEKKNDDMNEEFADAEELSSVHDIAMKDNVDQSSQPPNENNPEQREHDAYSEMQDENEDATDASQTTVALQMKKDPNQQIHYNSIIYGTHYDMHETFMLANPQWSATTIANRLPNFEAM